MSGTTPICKDQLFAAGWWLDWGQDPGIILGQPPPRWPVDPLGGRIAPRQPGPLCPPDAVYAPQGCTVTVTGPQVELRYVGDLYSCNVCQGDAVLVAPRSEDQTDPAAAPIAIHFEGPVHGAGAFVAAGSQAGLAGVNYRAVLWARLVPDGDWEQAIACSGTNGPFRPPGTPREAVFLGVQAPAGQGIAEIRFDIEPTGEQPVDQVAVSHLYVLG